MAGAHGNMGTSEHGNGGRRRLQGNGRDQGVGRKHEEPPNAERTQHPPTHAASKELGLATTPLCLQFLRWSISGGYKLLSTEEAYDAPSKERITIVGSLLESCLNGMAALLGRPFAIAVPEIDQCPDRCPVDETPTCTARTTRVRRNQRK
jgi:hypothetical protein